MKTLTVFLYMVDIVKSGTVTPVLVGAMSAAPTMLGETPARHKYN